MKNTKIFRHLYSITLLIIGFLYGFTLGNTCTNQSYASAITANKAIVFNGNYISYGLNKCPTTAGISSYCLNVACATMDKPIVTEESEPILKASLDKDDKRSNETVDADKKPESKKVKDITCYKKYTAKQFKRLGRVYYGHYSYTWYSEKVLPGGGLKIPGRHLNNERFVVDENGYLVIASDDLPKGTMVDTPVGIQGIVRDCGSGHGNLDIYVSW